MLKIVSKQGHIQARVSSVNLCCVHILCNETLGKLAIENNVNARWVSVSNGTLIADF